MAYQQPTVPPPIFKLPITGQSDGCGIIVVDYTDVLDDDFTHTVLTTHRWHLNNVYVCWDIRQPNGLLIHNWLHHIVYTNYHGPVITGMQVDHINRNPMINTPDNLRLVTPSISAANRGKRCDNTSGYVGVSWNKRRSIWVASTTVDGERIYHGSFTDRREAAEAVNQAYRDYFPGIAIPNP